MSAGAVQKTPMGEGQSQAEVLSDVDPQSPKRDDRVKRMGTASIPKLLAEFAIPAIIGMLVNGAYSVIDSMFLGHAIGEIGIAAMTVANPVMIVCMAIAMLVGTGGNALAALRLGEGKRDEAEITLGNTVFLGIVVSVLVALCVASPTILNMLLLISSSTDEVRSYAEPFIRLICFGFIFQCIGMSLNNFIRTVGAPNRALLTMIIGTGSCVFFNYLFVLQFGWGVEGSALATICGQAISCLTVIWYFTITKKVPLKLRFKYMKPKAKIVSSILSLGLAGFFVQAGAAVLNFVINYLLVKYGAIHPLGAENALASIGVVQRVAMFSVLPLIGVSVALQPLVGFNYGARLIGRVHKAFWYGVIGATIIGALMWLVIHILPEAIVGAFGISDENLVTFTVFALKVQLMMLPLIGFQIVGANYFQATGQPLKSVTLTLTRQILFLLPLLFVLPQILPLVLPQFTSLDALYFAAPIADTLAIGTTGVFVFLEMKRLKRIDTGKNKAKIVGGEVLQS